jgi:tRNA threonylcarbamoyladenosine modification (KEOPS) complex  Pcc1 subunit
LKRFLSLLKVRLLKAKAEIRLKFPSEKQLKTVSDALLPEVCKPVGGRAMVALENDGTYLLLKAEAEDTVALRSTLNAFLRWINSMTNVVEVLEHSS